MKPRLYGYWRSSASWRVRWAFALKKIPYDYVPVNLLKDEHKSPAHLLRNPMGAVPAVEVAPGQIMTQSMSLFLWLDENFSSENYLFGKDRTDRYKIVQLSEIINADTAPIQSLGVLQHFSDSTEKRADWAKHFIHRGLSAFEKNAAQSAGTFSVGNSVTAADLMLIPQMYNARRYQMPFEEFPLLKKIWDNCFATEECIKSSPEKQIDAVV